MLAILMTILKQQQQYFSLEESKHLFFHNNERSPVWTNLHDREKKVTLSSISG